MSAGLPATGLGGALYLLLIVWMLLRQLTRTANGISSESSRWPLIGKMVFVSLAMVLVVLGEVYIPGLAKFAIIPSGSFVLLMAAVPFVVLLMLIACLHFLRFWHSLSKMQPQGRGRFARHGNDTALPQALDPFERLVIAKTQSTGRSV
jgi:hypothetical protein